MGVSDSFAKIIIYNENGSSYIVFNGIIKNLSISSQGGLKTLNLELISGTYLMDLVEHIRTYQNSGMSYKTVLESFSKNYYNGGVYMTISDEASLGELIVQYKETDWNFAKRLASKFNSYIVAKCDGEEVK